MNMNIGFKSEFGISLMTYNNDEINDCFKEKTVEEENNDIDNMFITLSNLYDTHFLNNYENLKIYDKYYFQIIILYVMMKDNSKIMDYYLNYVKKKDITKYNQCLKHIQMNKINSNTNSNINTSSNINSNTNSNINTSSNTNSNTNTSSNTNSNSNIKKRRRSKIPVPEKYKDEKYWKKRKANTLSARRSRYFKKLLMKNNF